MLTKAVAEILVMFLSVFVSETRFSIGVYYVES